MLKKSACALIAVVLIFSVYFLSSKPLFSGLADGVSAYEVYQTPYSSNQVAFVSNRLDYLLTLKKYGESCTLKKGVCAENVFSFFNASVIFTENSENGVSYYGYTDNIKYFTYINGRRVNLHVYEQKEYAKVGSPIIFGSF